MKKQHLTLFCIFSFLASFFLCISCQERMFQCLNNSCDLRFDSQLDKVFEPVCAFQDNSYGQTSTTFDNVCEACSAPGYTQYQRGICEADRNSCSTSTALRPSNSEPVCAFFQSSISRQLLHTTVENAQCACSDFAVSFYKIGQCGPSRDNITYCLPNIRPEACQEINDPVCGYYKGKGTQLSHKVMSNACSACQDPTILYHTPGPCVLTCLRGFGSLMKCDGSKVAPICGTYQEGDNTVQVSLKNSCVGCHNMPFKITSYTEGLCPGDEGIRCKNDFAGFISHQISPVCGVFEEGCNDSSCRQTYADAVTACKDPSVVLYTAGMCAGEVGISCKPYRSQAKQAFGDGNVRAGSSNFCGYYEVGCKESSCRAGFRTPYDACNDELVLFFIEGACEKN